MFTDMEQWADIRRRVLIEGTSRRQIQRETGLPWKKEKGVSHFLWYLLVDRSCFLNAKTSEH
ncbi:MAG: hypothetical protein JHC52_12755 [Chthoniobacterales bacterium]|jgi:hypothetical protein|nr:hypothetical protein [Chthoniobacterales bacterium]